MGLMQIRDQEAVIDALIHIEGAVPEGVMLEKLGEALLAGLPR
jgi:hypothetical protein